MTLFWITFFLSTLVAFGEKRLKFEDKFDMNEFVPLSTNDIVAFTQVKGISEQSHSGDKFYSYLGIPYAEPPIEKLRLKDPVPIELWQGTMNATQMPQRCLQVDIRGPKGDVLGQEDCLYLNIHTKKPKQNDDLKPVMVYIYGGGFYHGGVDAYSPSLLMDKDIVLVFVQYRLGVLGFLSTEDSVIPGNFGLKDQTLALQWVQKHISQFGGDPNSVTLFGNSAGAASCHYHMLSPYSKGLFHRVILQSGNSLVPWGSSSTHRDVATELGDLLHCPPNASSQDLLDCFQRYNPNTMALSIHLYNTILYWPRVFTPRVDGDYLPDTPASLIVSGRFHKVDVIAGVNKDEGAFYTAPIFTDYNAELEEDQDEIVPLILGFKEEGDHNSLTAAVLDHFLEKNQSFNVEAAEEINKMLTARHFSHPHDVMMQYSIPYIRKAGKKAFMYELKHRGQETLIRHYTEHFPKHWVSHVDELFYLFDGFIGADTLEDQADLKLRRNIIQMWTNFAKTGNPTEDLGFDWKEATEGLDHLVLQPDPLMEQDTRNKEREFLLRLPTKNNQIFQKIGQEVQRDEL